MNKNLPTLPQSLINLIGEYGFARTDGVSEIERLHRWELLIAGIKDYAASVATQPPQDERGQGLSENEWLDLAERHANKDWDSAKPDGFLNAVKALCRDFAASAPAQQAPAMKNFSVSKEWLAEKLETHDDADAAAGQTNPQAPCKTYPGCNGSNCLGCGEATPPQPVAAEVPPGMVLLPIEPTPEMIEAVRIKYPFLFDAKRFAEDWRLVVNAAAMAGTGSDESKESGNG